MDDFHAELPRLLGYVANNSGSNRALCPAGAPGATHLAAMAARRQLEVVDRAWIVTDMKSITAVEAVPEKSILGFMFKFDNMNIGKSPAIGVQTVVEVFDFHQDKDVLTAKLVSFRKECIRDRLDYVGRLVIPNETYQRALIATPHPISQRAVNKWG